MSVKTTLYSSSKTAADTPFIGPYDEEQWKGTVWVNEALRKRLAGESQEQASASATKTGNVRRGDVAEEGNEAFIEAEPVIREEILAWFNGEITSIRGKSFLAELTDLEGKQSFIEVERRAFEPHEQGDIREGARFVYSVYRRIEPGGSTTSSTMQFLPPYVWSQAHEKYIEQRARQLYQGDGDTT